MSFRDREDAGRQLAVEVGCRFGIPDVVAAVSVGGGIVAQRLARDFARPLVFAYCEPLVVPGSDDADSAFGAVDPEGEAVLDYTSLASFRLSTGEIEEAKIRGLRRIRSFYASNQFPHI